MSDLKLSKVEKVILFELLNQPASPEAVKGIQRRLGQLGLEDLQEQEVQNKVTNLWVKTVQRGWGVTLGITLTSEGEEK